jgi:hypothetical protein
MNEIDLPYTTELEIIQDTLQIYFEPTSNFGCNYLKNRCQQTTRLTKLVIPQLEERAGLCFEQWHAWNFDSENEIIVDLSGWQFQGLNLNSGKCILPSNHKKYNSTEKNLQEHLRWCDVYDEPIIKYDLEELMKIYDDIKNKKNSHTLIPTTLDNNNI